MYIYVCVQNLVEMHGGEIGCKSKPRRGDDLTSGGSEFFFSIAHDEAAAQEYQNQKHRTKEAAADATDVNYVKPKSSEAILGNIQMFEGMLIGF